MGADDRQLKDLEKKLWQAADKLRNSVDAAEYKHVVLGLIFLKYVSDSFVAFREELRARLVEEGEDGDYIAAHKYVLTPGLYVGLAKSEDNGLPFAEKMQQLTSDLAENFSKSHTLEKKIKKNMRGLGFDL